VTTLDEQLAVALTRRRHRRVPERWLDQQPLLAAWPTIGELVDAIDDSPRADQIITALARVGRRDDEACLVALAALAPTIDRMIGRYTSPAYQAEVVTELSAVLLDSSDLDGLDRLRRRMARRAISRTYKRHVKDQAFRRHTRRMDATIGIACAQRPVDDLATDRVRLHEIRQRIALAIDADRLPPDTWTNLVVGKLTPSILGTPAAGDRRRTFRTTQVVRRKLTHTL
jgi:hypothetical protein